MIVIHIKTWKDWKKQFLDWVKEPRQETCIEYVQYAKVQAEKKMVNDILQFAEKNDLTTEQADELVYVVTNALRKAACEAESLIKKCQPKIGI